MLKPEALRAPLSSCGYRRDLLRADFRFGDNASAALVGFAQIPADSRSACVAVLANTEEPRKSVESCRLLGAPLVFVCIDDTLQWWKQGTRSAEWLETVHTNSLEEFFKAHKREFSPEAVYRAKTWGRFRSEYQLSFVDVGLMPLVEEEIGDALGRLIERNVSELKQRLAWEDVTTAQGHWLLKSVFWLVSGKVLKDKQVPTFKDLDFGDVREVFRRVASHYGAKPFSIGSQEQFVALSESARVVGQFSGLGLTTTESLAYVYENTLISKETRSSLGTHSTPSFLVDYIVGNLAEWIREIPENERSVFEPACGHAAFLVSAMRLLTELLPPEKAVASRRGPYLRSRLHGTDIDSFALELARLSLTLTDTPNPDGWDLTLEDIFVGDRLSQQAERNTIFLANPPFANFKPEERRAYARQDVELTFRNRAAEVLWRTIPRLAPGSVFGVVVPQTFLHSANVAEVRRFLIAHCELKEVCLFPDKVFSFSDAESAVVLGRRLLKPSRRTQTTRYRHVREAQMPQFRATFEASRTDIVPQSQFGESERYSLRVADLGHIWRALADNPTLNTIASLGKGLEYVGGGLSQTRLTYSDKLLGDSIRGFVHFGSDVPLNGVPTLYWMNLNDSVIRRAGSGRTIGTPQVLLNYAPVSRGPWRLKALIDAVGRPVTSRFIAVRPRDGNVSLGFLWALLNSPVANAYAFTHLSKRDNIVGEIRKIPVPVLSRQSLVAVEEAVRAYLDAATSGKESLVLQRHLVQVDLEILKLYSLPVALERALLDLFAGYERVGVPFTQTRYFPAELDHPLRLADFVEFEKDWSATNRERGRMIDKKITGQISQEERARLDALQAFAEYYLDTFARRPTRVLDELECRLSISSRDKDKKPDAGI